MKNVKPGRSRPRVLIDPGHYGSTYNRGAANGCYESAAMWKLSQFEVIALKAYGIDTDLTRTNINDNPGLIERGKMAADYDLAYSNHSNGGDGKAAYALGIYFAPDGCDVDQPSKEFARLMSGVVADTIPSCSVAKIWTRSSDYDRDKDGHKDDWYGFLRGAHSVDTNAVIIEHGFHDHKQTAAWLLVDANLKKLAEAKAAKIAEWFDVSKTSSTSSAPSTQKEGSKMYMKTLKEGDTGPQVVALQRLLIGYGGKPAEIIKASGGADGKFYSKTGDAVEAYQRENKDPEGNPLKPDRVVGPLCWGSMLGQ